MYEAENESEWLRDEISTLKKKPIAASLNKNKLSKYELDNLFAME